MGCHEAPATAGANAPLVALRRGPSQIAPGPEGTQPLSFPLLVQPVLDRHCVRCHDGISGPGRSQLALTGQTKKEFTIAYENLKKFARWQEWGDASLNQTVTQLGWSGADKSPLIQIIGDTNHAAEVRLTDVERRRLFLWLDANAPFYGAYTEAERLAQLQGKSVPAPLVQ